MIRGLIPIMVLLAAALLLPGSAGAFTVRTGDSTGVPAGETINDSLLISGQEITIDGTVRGDVFCAGQNVSITGNVTGDVICAGQHLRISGISAGDVRLAGQSVSISGNVSRNITAFGQTLTLEATTAGETLFAGQSVHLDGTAAREVRGAADSVILSGTVGDLNVTANRLLLSPKAAIRGKLTYVSDRNAEIAPGATVSGAIIRIPPEKSKAVPSGWGQNRRPASWIAGRIMSYLTHLVIGLVLAFFASKHFRNISRAMLARPGRAIGRGLLILLAAPLVVLLLVLTIFGIPVAGLAVLALILAVFISRIAAGMAVGIKISDEYLKHRKLSFIGSTFIGITASWIVFSVPVAGWLLSALAVLWGLGGFYFLVRPKSAA
ncbi:hypothetical protein A2Z33_06425 [Candidatus Gottesmanbacteria bacterium RBG_16_52_11]|uniref:DUF8173 domain-containing protein n=1 Tax=Candidatus Gottesmanbacteria bacterium RBG_16_52_11 TaxID=1798374 RepID=A0A1F5YXQ0_9BACT|nr:MAG: hypothetical protein A2Z33_06425 [Candidatus Gottesmanbacteria bacterium RBG_16_52_11]